MKVIIIGGNPAGLSAGSIIRRIHPDWEINIYEKDKYVSYGSCGIPYYVAKEVTTLDKLVTLTKEKLEKRNLAVHLYHEVINVNFDQKIVSVKDIKGEKQFSKEYDYLVIATGGKAKITEGLLPNNSKAFFVHTLNHAERLRNYLEQEKVKKVVIIGTGYIGLEMVEAYLAQGIKGEDITIIGPRLVFRSSMQDKIQENLKQHGINVLNNNRVKKIESKSDEKLVVILKDGTKLETDIVQISIGVTPATEIFTDSKLDMLPNGAIITDEFMQTNIPNVYAAGDCIASYHNLLKTHIHIPLAPAANKQGRIAGTKIAGKKTDPFPGIIGTAIFKVLDQYCAMTGITQEEATKLGYEAQTSVIENNEIAHYYPGGGKMALQLVFDTQSHLLLGAEIVAPSALGAKKIDVLATAITAGMKIDDLQKLDLAYAPPFAPVWDPILIAANVARKKCK